MLWLLLKSSQLWALLLGCCSVPLLVLLLLRIEFQPSIWDARICSGFLRAVWQSLRQSGATSVETSPAASTASKESFQPGLNHLQLKGVNQCSTQGAYWLEWLRYDLGLWTEQNRAPPTRHVCSQTYVQFERLACEFLYSQEIGRNDRRISSLVGKPTAHSLCNSSFHCLVATTK